MVVAAARIKMGRAGRANVAAGQVFVDGHYASAMTAQDGFLIPF